MRERGEGEQENSCTRMEYVNLSSSEEQRELEKVPSWVVSRDNERGYVDALFLTPCSKAFLLSMRK